MRAAKFILIYEPEQAEDSEWRLERIFEYLFEKVKETHGNGENRNQRGSISAPQAQ